MIFIFVIISLIYSVTADKNLRIAFLPWANLTKSFLYTIQPNDGLNITKKYIVNTSATIDPQTIFNDFWKSYVGYIVLFILGLLFIFIFTLVGLCFCCCRCCCQRCGAKPPGPSAGNTKKKRICLNVFLFLFTTMIAIGAIVAMSSNVILLDALKIPSDTTDTDGNVLANIESTMTSAISYINYVATNGLTKGVQVLRVTAQNLLTILYGAITLFTNTFLSQLNFDSIINSTNTLINGYTLLANQAQNLSNISSLHQTRTPTFDQYLQSLIQNITVILNHTACVNFSTNCEKVKSLLPGLIIGYNSSLINYTVDIGAVNLVSGFNISDLINSKATVMDSSLNMTSQVNSTLTGYINDFSNVLGPNSILFQNVNNSVTYKDMAINLINTYKNVIYTTSFSNSKSIQEGLIYDYYRYAFYGFTALIGIICLIALLFYVGLCYGVCGGPNFEDSSCCSKGAGSGFLMGGIALSYLFGWLIMLIVMIMFLIGGLGQTEVCRYISVGSEPKYLVTIDSILNATLTNLPTFALASVPISIPNIDIMQSLLLRCPVSTDLVSAFKIPPDYITTVSSTLQKQFVSGELDKMIQKIKNFSIPTISVATLKNNTDQINGIINQLKAINSTSTVAQLVKTVTVAPDISEIIKQVYILAQLASSSYPDFSSSINSSISELNRTSADMASIQSAYYTQKNSFIQTVSSMANPLRIVNDAVSLLPSKTNDAKTAALQAANISLSLKTIILINDTLYNFVISLGNCQGLAETINLAVSIVCTTILVPFNNLWMGMGWFLLFIIPALAVSVKLHGLYRISHVESDTSSHNRAYQNSNHFLSESDMEMIRMDRPKRI